VGECNGFDLQSAKRQSGKEDLIAHAIEAAIANDSFQYVAMGCCADEPKITACWRTTASPQIAALSEPTAERRQKVSVFMPATG